MSAENRTMPEALLVRLAAVKTDNALARGSRGARKLLVTEVYQAKEALVTEVEWVPPTESSKKCPVQVMDDAEVAVFNQHATQDRHYHKIGTEIYDVIEGQMLIEVESQTYHLNPGDMIVVNPASWHEVKPEGTEFVCRVVTISCGGGSDKYT